MSLQQIDLYLNDKLKENNKYFKQFVDRLDVYNIPINYEANETIEREYCGKNEVLVWKCI